LKSQAECDAEQRADWLARCIHFKGVQHDNCGVGIPYESFNGMQLPCIRQELERSKPCATCDRKETSTEEEFQKFKEEMRIHQQKIDLARRAFLDSILGKKGDVTSAIPCPIC
jgi:hypothetical protein